MPVVPKDHKRITIVVHKDCAARLDEMRQDSPVRTVQSILAPVVTAFSRGEIQQQYVQQVKK